MAIILFGLGHLSQIENVSYLFVVINHVYAPDFDFEASLTFFHCYFLPMASMLLFPILAASLAAGTPISSDKVHPPKTNFNSEQPKQL